MKPAGGVSPITPGEVTLKRALATQAARDQLTSKVNACLEESGGAEVWVSIVRIPRDLVEEVIAAFKSAGWGARIEHDPRDGDALVVGKKAGGRS